MYATLCDISLSLWEYKRTIYTYVDCKRNRNFASLQQMGVEDLKIQEVNIPYITANIPANIYEASVVLNFT